MDKVIWHEGMMLRPQHFQQHDRYLQQELNQRTLTGRRHNWGFFQLQLDPQYLQMGKIVLTAASGILPDGTLFDLQSSEQPLALDIPVGVTDSRVCLSLPLQVGNGVEAKRLEQKDVVARYLSYSRDVTDSNAGEHGQTQVMCARQAFSLQLEQDVPANWTKLAICQLLDVSPDGVVSLDRDFQPSLLDIQHSELISGYLREVISMLSHRGDQLAQRISSAKQLGGSEMGDFLMLQLINRSEPRLRHLLAESQVHPEQLYLEFLSLYGELATYNGELRRPNKEHAYRHPDLQACFNALMHDIRQHLSQVLEQHAIELALQIRKYGIQVATLHDHSLLEQAGFILAARANGDPDELRRSLPNQLKVGPVERIRQLVNLHLPGIALRSLPVAPRQLPYHSGTAYFALNLTPEDKALLESSGGFAFHVAGNFDGLELNFWAIRNS